MARAPVISAGKGTVLRREEERYHPRVARALVVLAKRLRALVSAEELERALASGNVDEVLKLYSKIRIVKQAAPLAAILRDAAVRVARATAREV